MFAVVSRDNLNTYRIESGPGDLRFSIFLTVYGDRNGQNVRLTVRSKDSLISS